jgi:hypothetical protein
MEGVGGARGGEERASVLPWQCRVLCRMRSLASIAERASCCAVSIGSVIGRSTIPTRS